MIKDKLMKIVWQEDIDVGFITKCDLSTGTQVFKQK
jgi:hypothetical protein